MTCLALAVFLGRAVSPVSSTPLLSNPGLLAVEYQKKGGYIDKTARMVIKPQFTSGGNFFEGLAAVTLGKKSGYIDATGAWVIELKPGWSPGHFAEGLAPVEVKTGEGPGKVGYINRTGAVVIPPRFEPHPWLGVFESGFADGLAKIIHQGKEGYIDKSGKQVIPAQFTDASPFSQGLAAVAINRKYGFIDKAGNYAVPLRYDAVGSFAEGLAAVKVGEKWGYIDKTGKVIIPPRFDGAKPFAEGLAGVRVGFVGRGGKYGFINKQGEWVIQPQFDNVGPFSEGLAYVNFRSRGIGYIDRSGKVVIQPLFMEARDGYPYDVYSFANGVAKGVLPGGYEAWIDKSGRFIWRADRYRGE
jgi:hypothetical protein